MMLRRRGEMDKLSLQIYYRSSLTHSQLRLTAWMKQKRHGNPSKSDTRYQVTIRLLRRSRSIQTRGKEQIVQKQIRLRYAIWTHSGSLKHSSSPDVLKRLFIMS